jgi:hypothetical protein
LARTLRAVVPPSKVAVVSTLQELKELY